MMSRFFFWTISNTTILTVRALVLHVHDAPGSRAVVLRRGPPRLLAQLAEAAVRVVGGGAALEEGRLQAEVAAL